MRTLGPREGLRFSRPSSLAAIGPVPRMYASRAAFGIAARRLAECAERVPADARIAVLVGSDDTRTPPFVSERYVALLKARGIAVSLTEIPQADHDAAFRSRTTLMGALELIRP